MIACVCVKFHSLGQKKKSLYVFSLDCSLPGGQQWLDFSGSILYVYTHLDLGEQELEFDTCPCSVSRGFSNLSGEVPGPQVHQGNGLTFKLPFSLKYLSNLKRALFWVVIIKWPLTKYFVLIHCAWRLQMCSVKEMEAISIRFGQTKRLCFRNPKKPIWDYSTS